MKVIIVDNSDRETVSDRLLAEALDPVGAKRVADAWQAENRLSDGIARVVPDNHKLYVYNPA